MDAKLKNSEKGNGKQSVENVKETLLHDNKTLPAESKDKIVNKIISEEKAKVPILEIIAPNIKTESKDKVIVENVKEQSLEKEKGILSAEPIKKLKEKIIGSKETKEIKEQGL